MPRQARVVAVDVPHHITHRGNNRQDVFLSDEDRCRYQQLLSLHLRACRVDLLGWCWMTNHVHMIAVPRREDSLARLIRRVHSGHAQQFNRTHHRDGHLWKSRFYSCALDPDHLDAALLYVDLNPVRAAITTEATAWRWSSARAHATGRDDSGLLDWLSLEGFGGCADWAARLSQPRDEQAADQLRTATQSGKPFGDEHFQRKLEADLDLAAGWSRIRSRGGRVRREAVGAS